MRKGSWYAPDLLATRRPRSATPAVDQYLVRYAEPEVALATQITAAFGRVVVIPACDETSEDLLSVTRALAAGSLVIVVVNARVDAPALQHARNSDTLAQLKAALGGREIGAGQTFVGQTNAGHVWLVVDRTSDGRRFARRQGVGLARKIGCDVAVALAHAGRLKSRFIHTTDADAILETDYACDPIIEQEISETPRHEDDPFASLKTSSCVALTYRFRHVGRPEEPLDLGHACYETYLRYLRLGLAWAGSPYAHHTIGSTLAVDFQAYAKVRGMPKRQAGEDFHLLNKLRKLGRVSTPKQLAPVRLRARPSTRVPFGTGQAALEIERRHHDGEDYLVDSPSNFERVRLWLALLNRAAERTDAAGLAQTPGEIHVLNLALTVANRSVFEQLVSNNAAPDRKRRQLHEWFDGLRTLQLLRLPDQHQKVPLREALLTAPFIEAVSVEAVATSLEALIPIDEST